GGADRVDVRRLEHLDLGPGRQGKDEPFWGAGEWGVAVSGEEDLASSVLIDQDDADGPLRLIPDGFPDPALALLPRQVDLARLGHEEQPLAVLERPKPFRKAHRQL